MVNTINNIKIYITGLIALLHAGNIVFANSPDFMLWLTKKNFFFEDKAPIRLLVSIEGTRFVKDKVAAIENVHLI